MADGRNFASWQPEAVVNEHIQQKEHITSNWKYRQFLTNNAEEVMKMNNREACSDLGLPSHLNTGATPSSNVPFTFKSFSDTARPGFGYNNSDLKNPYLSREELQARMIAPAIRYGSETVQPNG
jgi:hypothetical protein